MVSKDTGLYAEPLADDQLLERFSRGQSQEAFAALVARYAGLVFATCRRRLRSADRAEDASQAVFILLARNANRLRARHTLAPWLYRMSDLVCKGLMHQDEKMKRAANAWHDSVLAITEPDPALSLTLDAALAKLPRKDRDAIVMHYLQGLTLGELAVAIGSSPDAVRMRISRALKQMRPCLESLGYAVTAEQLPAKLDGARIEVPRSLLPRLQVANSAPDVSRAAVIARDTTRMIQLSTVKIALPTFAGSALLATLAGHLISQHAVVDQPLSPIPYHVVDIAVQPAGGNRDPNYVAHKTGEQWIDSNRQRLMLFDYWKPNAAPTADYLLDLDGVDTHITVRSTHGDVLKLTRSEAVNGTQGGKWAQPPQLSPIDDDFTKIEHFWRSAVVTRLPRTKVTSFGAVHAVDPVQVTVKGFFRMTGYLDANSGRLVKQETYSRDGQGWYLIGYDDFDYAPLPNDVFDPDTLAKTSQFEYVVQVAAKNG